jgi:uncharacterized zinc-type alcohol dehydrogenase-like protein
MEVKEGKEARSRSTTFDAYAAMEAGQRLQQYQYTPKELGPHNVEIEITHCGICHTDLHLINNDFGLSAYPLVPGHEVVGIVTRAGSDVQQMLGVRVGVGWLAGADFTCEQCAAGRDNVCLNWEPTCLGREGGYASRIRVDARLAFPIPDALSSEHAAPLLCAGVTVFSPLLRHNIAGPARLGVIGIGGLGHLAIQYGRALGCHVTAFSTTPEKEEEALGFGADVFITTTQTGAFAQVASSLDLIVSTVTADVPWGEYVNALKPNGKLCVLGVPQSDLTIPVIPLIFGQKSVITGAVGSRWEMRAMLDFSARRGIVPQVELFPMTEVNHALDRLGRNEIRYRAVLAAS